VIGTASGRPRRLVVFDLDGTLVDSLRDLAESTNTLLVECGLQPLPNDEIGSMVGDGAALLVSRAFAAAGSTQPADALSRFLGVYNTRLLRHTTPYPQIPDVLKTLSSRHDLAVLTNKPLQATQEILGGLDLARYFGEGRVVGGDGPFPRKPDPAGLLHLVRLARVTPPETVLVGDSAIDWRTGRAAGTGVCLARYGFGFRGVPLTELSRDDRIVNSPADLSTLL
jgi:phosphoglycolate phosphatase